MRVYEVAKEFNLDAEKMIQLLRGLGAQVRTEGSAVDDATVAKLRARFERERRAGHVDVGESLDAVMGDVQPPPARRRRRKKADLPEPEPAEPAAEVEAPAEEADVAAAATADSTADAIADAAEAIAAEAAEEAAAAEASVQPFPEVEEPTAADVERAAEAAEPTEFAEEPAPVAAAAEQAELAEEEPAEEPAAPTEREAAEPVPADARPRLRRAAEVLGRSAPPARPAPAASAGPSGQVRIQAEGFTTDGRRKKDKRKKKSRRVDQGAVQENISRVMAELKSGGRKRRHRRDEAPSRVEIEAERRRRAEEEATTVRVNEFLTVAELAEQIGESPSAIVGSAFKNLGLMVTINQRLDFDQIELLLEEFGFRAVRETEYGAGLVTDEDVAESEEDQVSRPPVVTIMGHVDHGKTSLLDYVRKTNVIAGESGGITQHIGAYHVELPDDRSITFLDTPGHAAFTAMRARGADVTDLVVLVVAADDSVMPQTIEAISHARNAGVPIIVAINKMDVPGANAQRIQQDLLQHGVVVEEFGGQVLAAAVSAKTGQGVDDLLEKVLLQAELMDLRANPKRAALGTVVEAQLDVGKGPVATALVTNGTLRVGDSFVCGHYDGRVRALLDERGHAVEEAGPGTPVVVLGISGVPQAGDLLAAMEADRASEIAQTRQRLEREKQLRIKARGVKLTDIAQLLAQGEQAHLNLIIKGDVDGSVQALTDSLAQLSTPEVEIEIIHRGVGAVNESDVLLASTSGAIIIGFHVRPDANARTVAAREDVDIRLYNIIYEVVEDVRAALEGMLQPEEKEVVLGEAEVRQLFKVPRVGTIAGCYVTEGVIDRRARARIVRDAVSVYEGEIGSLKRFKDDVREVREGFECGLNITGYNDLKVGDRIECYRIESVARTLAGAAEATN